MKENNLDGLVFDYAITPISDLAVESEIDPQTNRPVVNHVLVNGEPIEPSPRFWTSLFARFGFNQSFFTYFTYDEVFVRIAQGGVSGKVSSDQMRVCIERKPNEKGEIVSKLMGVSNPSSPVVEFPALRDQLLAHNARSLSYLAGEVHSSHAPRVGAGNFDVSGNTFSNRFVMATPIDGYGRPNFYLSLLRQVCDNDIVAVAKAFKSQLNLGKGADDVMPTIVRALDGFGNDEGFAALRQRMEASAMSWASVAECHRLYKLIIRLHVKKHLLPQDSMLTRGPNLHGYMLDKMQVSALSNDTDIACPLLTAFHKMTGDLNQIYGLANIDSLTQRRQRTLPAQCTVYDLFNFVTEVATHYAVPDGARQLQALVGTLLAEEYDMENTKQTFDDFQDFMIGQKLGAGVTGS